MKVKTGLPKTAVQPGKELTPTQYAMLLRLRAFDKLRAKIQGLRSASTLLNPKGSAGHKKGRGGGVDS